MIVDEIVGRFTAASNATLLGRSAGSLVIYKPVAGNRPLWDFDVATLAAREVLTFDIADAMGITMVPRTVLGDGPFGPGAVQTYIEIDASFDPLDLATSADPSLWPLVILDVVVNNADRKLGHILRESGSQRLFGIDHGLTFHSEDKLRTVLWGFAGRPVPARFMDALESLDRDLNGGLGRHAAELIGVDEVHALRTRVIALLASGTHPEPPHDRPPVPWPPY